MRRFIDSSLAAVYRRWQTASLTSKIVLPSAALVVLSLIGAAILLSEGSNVLRRRFLEQQVDDDAETVATLLEERLEALAAASELLAADPEISQGLLGETEPVENGLRSRATAVLARFELSLVHVYDRAGRRRVALIRPGICLDVTTSSSIPNLAESDKTVARAVDDRLLLLSERDVLGGAGTVVVGTDLETELERIRHREGLATEIGLSLRGTRVGTDMELAADDQRTSGGPHVHEERLVLLGATPAQLLLTRRNDDARQVTRYAAIAVVSSTIVTAVSLSGLNAMTLRSLSGTLRRLSEGMDAAGHGRLDQVVRLPAYPLALGEADELGTLVDSFNEMTQNLRDHRDALDAKATVHCAGLATAAALADALSSSLQLSVILEASAEIIEKRLREACPGVYHVGIFLVARDADVAVLRQAAGDIGGESGPRSFQVPIGSGSPVGRATATRRPQIIRDVRSTCVHVKPPLLMDTYSAVAVPLLVDDVLIGALDVQSTQPGSFSAETLPLLTTLANQIACAVHSARSYERQQRAAERLADVDERKRQFLTVMSHKFRASLSTITALSRDVLQRAGESLTDRQRQDLDLVSRLGQYLTELTEDFLDISQLDGGPAGLNLADVDVRLLIRSALDTVAPLIDNRPVSLSAEIASDLPIVRADKRRLRQVMLNLLSSAATFTESGRINVRARQVEMYNAEVDRVEPFVEVCIGETGAIGPGDVPGTTPGPGRAPTLKGAAAGLGLPITETLVDLHGGRIWTGNNRGEGTVFTFVLPVTQPEPAQNSGAEKR